MWFAPDDGSELCDFVLEAGGAELNEWGYSEQTDELRRTILYLVHERNSMLVKLRGLSAMRDVLQHVHSNRKCDLQTTDFYRRTRGAEHFQGTSVCTGGYLQAGPTTRKGAGNLLRKDDETASLDDDKQWINTKESDLITNLRQTNQELQEHVKALQQVTCSSDSSESCWEGCSKRLRSQLVRYIVKARKLEKSLKAKEVLCSLLAEKLDVMKDEKTKSGGFLRMSNKETNGNSISHSKAGDDCTCPSDPPPASEQGNRPMLASSQERAKNSQNEENVDKACKPVHGGVICREEEQVAKTKCEALEKKLGDVNDELNKVMAEKSKLEKCVRDLHDIRAKDEQAFKAQIDKLQQEKKQLQDTVLHYQSSDHKQKQEFEQMLFRVQDMLERERQEKFSSIAEQKSLRQQVENMSKTMKTLQVKNEEFVRFHCDQEDQIDDFKRLKKLIHDNGLPSIEQLIVLQRQNETYREDFLNERKEKERILSLKDKLKRDLDGAQSRISSLQEQVYKYREHIFFLQQKFRQEGISQAGPAMFDMPAQSQGNNLSRLYGTSTTQYVNEVLLQGNAQGKFPAGLLPDGKKPGPGKHVEGPGKPWQYQQGNYGRYGRQMSAEDWKRSPSQDQAVQQQQQAWDTFYGSSQSPGRLSSGGSLSSVRSSSSSSEDVPTEGPINGRAPYGMGTRRQSPRPTGLPDKPLDESRAMHQNYGPPLSPFEAWSPKHQGFHMRGQRRYSSPTGNGVRSPTAWSAHQQMGGFQRSWQASPEQAQFGDSTPVSVSSGLRPTADPWPAAVTSGQNSGHAQSSAAMTVHGDTMGSMSGGFSGMRC